MCVFDRGRRGYVEPLPSDFDPSDQMLRRVLLMSRITQALYLRNITCASLVFDIYLL